MVWRLAVWDGLQNLNKLALGDMTRENFQVRAHYSSDGYFSPGKLGSGSLYVYIYAQLGKDGYANYLKRDMCSSV